MQCIEFRNVAGDWMDGQAHPDAAAHLAACAACQGLIADLNAIRAAGAELASETDLAPPARVWTSLRARLEAEGIIRDHSEQGWFTGLFAWAPRPALAGAYFSILVAAALFLGIRPQDTLNLGQGTAPQPALVAPANLRESGVTQRTVSAMHEHNPDVTASYQKSLAIVDNSIRMCEKTLREEPQNNLAREYLYAAYQQKADLLAAMAERGATGD